MAEMIAKPQDNPVLKRFRATVTEIYGDCVERVVLFGSRARGEARDDSDYDVAVFLRELTDYWGEADRIVELETDILLDTGAIVQAVPFPAGSYEDRTSLMREVRL